MLYVQLVDEFYKVFRKFIFIYIVIGDWHASEAVVVRMTKV